jgi:hypothetical protein
MANSNALRKRRDLLAEWSPARKPIYVDEWHQHPHTEDAYKKCVDGHLRPRQPTLAEIEIAISTSRKLVEMPEDWDNEGAKQIPRETWELATNLLRVAARTAFRRFGYVLPPPKIGPCSDGSIDLYWGKGADFTLLINVKPGLGETSDYYGERLKTKVQGPLNPLQPNLEFLSLLLVAT